MRKISFALSLLLSLIFAFTSVFALNNDLKGWGFKRVNGKAPDMPANICEMLAKYDAYFLGDTSGKNLYLTFDQGYEAGYTAKILDVLKENDVKAAFFVTGHYLEKEKELIKRMVDEGHIIGNHSDKHKSAPTITKAEQEKEIKSLEKMFKADYDAPMVYYRPPKGEYSEATLANTKELGYKTIFWSSAYVDWELNNQKGTDYAFGQITKQFHDGNIILLHAVSKDNANCLDAVIKEAKKQGYSFKTLDEI